MGLAGMAATGCEDKDDEVWERIGEEAPGSFPNLESPH